ncbi:MAG: SCO family protein [Terriglobia bacterium]
MFDKMTRRSLIKGFALAPLGAVLVKRLSFSAESAESSSRESRGWGANFFTNFVLTTHEGKKVRFYDDLIRGKTVLLNFFHAKCGKCCPPHIMNLVKVQNLLGDRLGRNVFMYSLTLEPHKDTPKVLKAYAEEHGAKWHFLTGKPNEIEILRRRLGFVDPAPALERATVQHIGKVLYGNEARNLWAACPALTTPEEIIGYVNGVADGSNSKPIA